MKLKGGKRQKLNTRVEPKSSKILLNVRQETSIYWLLPCVIHYVPTDMCQILVVVTVKDAKGLIIIKAPSGFFKNKDQKWHTHFDII